MLYAFDGVVQLSNAMNNSKGPTVTFMFFITIAVCTKTTGSS